LPSGWSLLSLDPSEYVLDISESAILTATFSTPPRISSGELAFVEFDVIRDGASPRGHTVLGLTVVPEPSAFTLLAVALLGSVWMHRRVGRARGRPV
jgi:hypothetical protein